MYETLTISNISFIQTLMRKREKERKKERKKGKKESKKKRKKERQTEKEYIYILINTDTRMHQRARFTI